MPPIAQPSLGPCCACEQSGPTVRNLIALNQQAPILGTGWGCVVCHLPADGGLAVLCDDCLGPAPGSSFKRPPRFAILGYPGAQRRIAIEELTGTHQHNIRFHPELAKRN